MRTADRRSALAALGLMAWWGYAAGVNGAAAPLLAASFGIAEPALASALAWIGIASLGALALGRLTDRIGRRRVALATTGLLPLAAAASALAPTLPAYVAAQTLVYGCGTSLLAALVVLVADRAEPAQRARAQSRAGVAFLIGTALPLVVCASIAPHGVAQAERWRWLWWIAVLPALAWPCALLWLRDAAAWRASEALALGSLVSHLRGQAPRLVATAALVAAAEVAARSWLFFHAVAVLGLAPRRALAVIAAGGAASLAGFGVGARLADRLGRRMAFLAGAALFALGATGYFGTSLDSARDPVWLLLVSFAAMGIGGNAATTAFRTHATELTPVRSRGALAGSLAVANAAGWVAAMFAASALAHAFGSLGLAVTGIVVVAVPAAIVLVLCLPETRTGPGGGAATPVVDLDELDAAA
jgi:MFS family permease